MKSWELLRELFAPKGIKYFAGLAGRSGFTSGKDLAMPGPSIRRIGPC